jgi:hypothetical protein
MHESGTTLSASTTSNRSVALCPQLPFCNQDGSGFKFPEMLRHVDLQTDRRFVRSVQLTCSGSSSPSLLELLDSDDEGDRSFETSIDNYEPIRAEMLRHVDLKIDRRFVRSVPLHVQDEADQVFLELLMKAIDHSKRRLLIMNLYGVTYHNTPVLNNGTVRDLCLFQQ